MDLDRLTPRQIVAELDRYIVGQDDAKRAVAVALRNRIRRQRLSAELQEEIIPKNILMIGPTGVGKTEIARRLAKLVNAPFIKVEATKFTEVGYVGRDVESMVRDLVETAIRMLKQERLEQVRDRAAAAAEERLVELLVPGPARDATPKNPLEALFGAMARGGRTEGGDDEEYVSALERTRTRRADVSRQLADGELEEEVVEVEVEDTTTPTVDLFGPAGVEEIGMNIQGMLGGMLPKHKKRRRVPVREARQMLIHEEAQRLVDMDAVTSEAVARVEQSGIIFVDELDKIAGREKGGGPDVSREGVQRDILPIVEGSTVMTKYGPVRTDHILFMAAGAFTRPSPQT